MRPIIAAVAAFVVLAAAAPADAGTVKPIPSAYGGGSNAAAVIASRPSAGSPPTAKAPAGGGSQGAAPSSGGGSKGGPKKGHATKTTPQPLVGIAAAPVAPAASFNVLNRVIPEDALWAVALAIACALGAWLVTRRRGAR